MQVDYSFPTSVAVSPECKDLLAKILIADPDKRITVQQILRHPWYMKVRCCKAELCHAELLVLSDSGAAGFCGLG